MSAATTQKPDHRPISDTAFAAISRLAREEAGLVLSPSKMTMVQSRLRVRLREVKLPDLDAYARFVCSEAGIAERRLMISALTTNVSHFYREAHHFALLRDQVLPRLIARARAGGRVRIWSAGCSSGQEPYSIAMDLLSVAPDMTHCDVLILASDIDGSILEAAKSGIYTDTQISGIPAARRKAFLIEQDAPGAYMIAPPLRQLVRFRELNLLRDWPMTGRFDVIFCRNVVIYFDGETQAALWPRFRRALQDDGWMFVGHSERIPDAAQSRFTAVGQTAYRAAPPDVSARPPAM
ncbi:protein-glutamate O-methyltransferase [Pseudooceanicola sp.]|uniref:CheR family methyltransferase n=1 Tax=Pseudooceanicola sp. TaxID=1914328 RepID=UPI002616B9E3|nr:protein-glutamate O-methyltransferase [Pseudooceanicola sp.]MDF1854077.1 protein-glutamate O-methyltransferase [Pseudooceanicola sp.]